MPFVVVCPHCQHSRFRVPSSKRGGLVVCPKCGGGVSLVPGGEPVGCTSAASVTPGESLRAAIPAVSSAVLAVLLSPFPFGRVIGVGLAVVGMLLGWLTAISLERHVWRGWIGVGINGVVLLVLLAAPATLGLSGWSGRGHQEPTPEGLGESPSSEWVDAGEAAWEWDGVRVTLTFATIRPDPAATGQARNERHLWIGVRVMNLAEHPLEFGGWDPEATERPALTLADGTSLPSRRLGGKITHTTLKKNDSAECFLVFSPPANKDDDLFLVLPAQPISGTVPVRFRLAQKLILLQ